MLLKLVKFLSLHLLIFYLILSTSSATETINEIQIIGNERISNETIQMFSDIKINETAALR